MMYCILIQLVLLFQPNIMTTDEYKRGERGEQQGDSPKTEFQVNNTFER